MNDKVIHRGPDDEGYYFGRNFGFGFRRLAILDLTPLGHQPMEYENLVIIYNGEIYNYVELREQLIKDGYIFKTRTDTEVILVSYKKWGKRCVEFFNGMWSFVLYDKNENILFCSRDRYGIKPFNYTIVGNKFVISSEIKQFTAVKGFNAKQNHNKVLLFLQYSKLNFDDETLFEDVKILPSGSNLIYNLSEHSFKIIKYYDQSSVNINSEITFAKASEKFYKIFENAVKIRLRSDVPVGSCLSGGMDSSSIVSMVKKINFRKHAFKTISSCYDNKKYDEQEFIDEVVSYSGFENIKVFPDLNDLLSNNILAKINYHQDQPISTASHFSEYSVFRVARENNLIVMLDGQGADEFLAGYKPFELYNYNLFKNFRFLKLLLELKYQLKYHYQFNQIIRYNSKYFFKHLLYRNRNKKYPAYPKWINKNFIKEIEYKKDEIASPNYQSLREQSLSQINYSSIPYQLHSEDRNSMMNSVESRLPFLDFELTDFIFSLPDDFKLKNGETKAIMRESLNNILPSKIRNRHSKMGFVAPDEVFIRNQHRRIKSYLINAIELSNEMLNNSIIKEFDDMIEGRRKYDQLYFRILSYFIWCEAFSISITR